MNRKEIRGFYDSQGFVIIQPPPPVETSKKERKRPRKVPEKKEMIIQKKGKENKGMQYMSSHLPKLLKVSGLGKRILEQKKRKLGHEEKYELSEPINFHREMMNENLKYERGEKSDKKEK